MELRMRRAMALAAISFEQAKALIDHGVASNHSQPHGTAYLLSTSDNARNIRAVPYPRAKRLLYGRIRGRVQQDALRGADGVLFYFCSPSN